MINLGLRDVPADTRDDQAGNTPFFVDVRDVSGAKEIRIVVYGKPVSKARARTYVLRRKGGALVTFMGKNGKPMPVVKSYTPSSTTDAEASIVAVAQQIVREGRAGRLEGAVEAELWFYRDLPKSCSKKKREAMLAGLERPSTKPDWDNLGKLVTDALEGVLYANDAALTDVLVRKRYSEQPRTEIVLREVACVALAAPVLLSMAGSGELFEARALTCGQRRSEG